MLRNIEYLIPAALEAIDAVLLDEKAKKKGIPGGYQGAVSGFGTSLLQMGLLPTLAVYADDDHPADIDRRKLLQILIKILKHKDSKFDQKSSLVEGAQDLLKKIARTKDFPREVFKEKLLEASLAFKLAIRTYKLDKS